MVNPAVRAYMQLEKPRQRLDEAAARVEAAYKLYQQALAQLSPFPQHGWDRTRLAARADALAASIEAYRLAVSEVVGDLSLIELKPPF